MRPLLFLTARTFVNGVKRSLTSGRRLIGLLFFVSYYIWIMRPAWRGESTPGLSRAAQGMKFDLPPVQTIEALVFALFVLGTLLLALGALTYRHTFKPADVDVLFPTPVSPKVVLGFRLLRDSLLTLLIPLFMAIVLYRPASEGWATVVKGLPRPESAGLMLRAGIAAWLLSSMAWVAMGVGWSLAFGPPDDRREAIRTRISWGLGGVFLVCLAYAGWSIRFATAPQDYLDLAHSPLLRIPFFLASAASHLTVAPLAQNAWWAAVGGGVLIGTTALAVGVAMRHSGWLYELAASNTSKASDAAALQRQGDLYGLVAQQARLGKVKAGRATWVNRLRVTGPRSLLWKEYLVQSRAGRSVAYLFLVLSVVLGLIPSVLLAGGKDAARGLAVLTFALLTTFIATASTAQAGFLEMLRRGDLQKPLPFSPSVIVFHEIAGKALLGGVCGSVACLAALIARPSLWESSLAGLILFPAIALLLSAAFCAITVLFPDVEDPTQRMFRSLMTMLGLILFCGPSAALFAGLMLLKVPPIWAAIPTALLNFGVAWVAASISGALYASFNPSE